MPDLVLYDGVCGFCNRLNRFILARDSHGRFRFAAIQSTLGGELLRRNGREASDLDTVYVVVDYGGSGERLLSKSQAVLFVLRSLGGIWAFSRIFQVFPSSLLDAAYDFFAKRRYRWFGRFEQCVVPEPEHRSRFLDWRGP